MNGHSLLHGHSLLNRHSLPNGTSLLLRLHSVLHGYCVLHGHRLLHGHSLMLQHMLLHSLMLLQHVLLQSLLLQSLLLLCELLLLLLLLALLIIDRLLQRAVRAEGIREERLGSAPARELGKERGVLELARDLMSTSHQLAPSAEQLRILFGAPRHVCLRGLTFERRRPTRAARAAAAAASARGIGHRACSDAVTDRAAPADRAAVARGFVGRGGEHAAVRIYVTDQAVQIAFDDMPPKRRHRLVQCKVCKRSQQQQRARGVGWHCGRWRDGSGGRVGRGRRQRRWRAVGEQDGRVKASELNRILVQLVSSK
jgi:hypothetical protein